MTGLVLLNTATASKEAWLSARKLGSSDAAAVLGLNPWRSPTRVYLEMRGEVEPFAGNESTEFGQAFQDQIAEVFSKRTGLKVERSDVLLQHPDLPWKTSTPDFWVWEDGKQGVCEIKLEGYPSEDDETLPDAGHVQVLDQLAVTGLSFGYLVRCIRGVKLVYHRVERDEELISQILGGQKAFMEMVQAGTPPAVSADDTDLLNSRFPLSVPEVIELPSDAERLINLYQSASAKAREHGKVADAAANQLKEMLGNYERGLLGEHVVTWRNVERKGYEVKPTTYRKFSISKRKGVTNDGKE